MEVRPSTPESRNFFRSALHYIDKIAAVAYKGLDLQNKKIILEKIYTLTQCQNRRLLAAAYTRLEAKLKD